MSALPTPGRSVHTTPIRTAFVKNHSSPTLLIARRMIEQAFHDSRLKRNGVPTESALEAQEWLNARTDWTIHGGEAPPPELRQEFPGTFDWACRWLGENPEQIRGQGGVIAAQRYGTPRRGSVVNSVIAQRLEAMQP